MPGISSGFFGSSKVVRKLGDVNYAPTQKECKKILAWSKEAITSFEADSRKEIARILTVVIPMETKNLNFSYKDPSGLYEVEQTERGYKHVFKFSNLSLTSFPDIKTYCNSNISVLDLSNNLLKKIPSWGCCDKIIMSGNPLDECLDSLRGDVVVLELKNCGIIELTIDFFEDLRAMSRQHNEFGPFMDSLNGVVYKIDISGNPLSERSKLYLKGYRKRYRIPQIVGDEDDKAGSKISDLDKVYKGTIQDNDKISWEGFLKSLFNEIKAVKYASEANREIIESNKKRELRIAKKIEIKEDFQGVIEYFGISNGVEISNVKKLAVTKFLRDIQPLSYLDLHFKEYVRDVFNNIFKDENSAEILSKILKNDNSVTFNKINELMLMDKVMKGEFDNNSNLLKQSLRDLFFSMQIKKQNLNNELDFVRWESFLQDELKMDIQKKSHLSFVPPESELIMIKDHILSAQILGLKKFMEDHAIWKEFLKRSLPEV